MLTNKGLLDIKKFKWLNLRAVANQSTGINYIDIESDMHTHQNKEMDSYDLSRYCELEIMKNKWKPLEKLTSSRQYITQIKEIFEPILNVEKVVWDDVGYTIFKFYLQAKVSGTVDSKKELGIEVKVVGKSERTVNEIKKNCLLYDRKSLLQLREGDTLVLYVSKSK